MAPLQVYSSALVFAAERSVIRRTFEGDMPRWITNIPIAELDWSLCLQTLTGHDGSVHSVAFSTDGSRLASGSNDATVKI
ncbi:hypothetical protein QBC33DRAFT_560493 [Phialemonium atrogriseum]|uniref:Uncharacterized protein n=1 Tax=Phialemonium atrogriseum TaxID=1093897 RepID=A0AAJ0FEY5_9PEZI|nr:uncharacterized protein QBC33DRAFT_560493 [Phialemonium atrogriseum]KAK1766061.1 hypothetical protein QBC33DRAFT_560493 [Phialemonium atrogriseum]